MLLPFLISLTWPTANSLVVVVWALLAPVLAIAPVNVTGFVAVTDTAWLLVVPTAVRGRVAVVATAGEAAPGASGSWELRPILALARKKPPSRD